MNPLDEALARVISARDPKNVSALEPHFPRQFLADLTHLLDKQSSDPNRWLALATGVAQASLHAAAAASFSALLDLLGLAKERAKVFVEWARIEEATGLIRNSAAHYATAYRLDAECSEAKAKAEELGARFVPRIMLGQWDVFGALNDPVEFASVAPYSLFPSLNHDILRADMARRWSTSLSLFKMVAGDPVNCSYVVTKASRPVLLVECDVRGDRHLTCREVPILLSPAKDAAEEDLPVACELAFRHLVEVARFIGAGRICLEEPDLPVLTPVSVFASQRPATRYMVERSRVDLTQGPDAIWKEVRKGHRHAINWGKSHLELRFWDGSGGPIFQDFMGLYRRAGRPQSFGGPEDVRSFWSGGAGELIVAYLDGAPMSAVAVSYERGSAYYMTGISVDHGEIPSSHWPVYHALMRAREKGIETFDFGYLQTDSDKQRAIAHFKKGFTKQATRHIWWVVSPHPYSGERVAAVAPVRFGAAAVSPS